MRSRKAAKEKGGAAPAAVNRWNNPPETFFSPLADLPGQQTGCVRVPDAGTPC